MGSEPVGLAQPIAVVGAFIHVCLHAVADKAGSSPWQQDHVLQEVSLLHPSIPDLDELVFQAPVTFLIGENGTGKSTLLEAIAVAAGFNAEAAAGISSLPPAPPTPHYMNTCGWYGPEYVPWRARLHHRKQERDQLPGDGAYRLRLEPAIAGQECEAVLPIQTSGRAPAPGSVWPPVRFLPASLGTGAGCHTLQLALKPIGTPHCPPEGSNCYHTINLDYPRSLNSWTIGVSLIVAEREMGQLSGRLRDRSAQRSGASEQVRDNGESASAHVPFLTSPLGILCTRRASAHSADLFQGLSTPVQYGSAADPALRRNGSMGAPHLVCL